MAEFTGIRPTKKSSADYHQEIVGITLDPLQKAIIERLKNAQNVAFDWQRTVNSAFDDVAFAQEVRENADDVATDHFEDLNQYHEKKTVSQMSRVLSLDVRDYMNTTPVQVALSRRIRSNIDLISTIIPELREQFNQDFQTLVFTEGFDQAKVLQLLTQRFNVADSRARLIATDQSGKAIGEFTKIRQQEVGFKDFIWRSSEDPRVRPEHVLLNNRIFSWETGAPGEGLPGEPIRCRCVAIPHIPSYQEIPAISA